MNANELAKMQEMARSIRVIAEQLADDMRAVEALTPAQMAERPAYWVAQVEDITLQYGQRELSKRAMALHQYLPQSLPSNAEMEQMAGEYQVIVDSQQTSTKRRSSNNA